MIFIFYNKNSNQNGFEHFFKTRHFKVQCSAHKMRYGLPLGPFLFIDHICHKNNIAIIQKIKVKTQSKYNI